MLAFRCSPPSLSLARPSIAAIYYPVAGCFQQFLKREQPREREGANQLVVIYLYRSSGGRRSGRQCKGS